MGEDQGGTGFHSAPVIAGDQQEMKKKGSKVKTARDPWKGKFFLIRNHNNVCELCSSH